MKQTNERAGARVGELLLAPVHIPPINLIIRIARPKNYTNEDIYI